MIYLDFFIELLFTLCLASWIKEDFLKGYSKTAIFLSTILLANTYFALAPAIKNLVRYLS